MKKFIILGLVVLFVLLSAQGLYKVKKPARFSSWVKIGGDFIPIWDGRSNLGHPSYWFDSSFVEHGWFNYIQIDSGGYLKLDSADYSILTVDSLNAGKVVVDKQINLISDSSTTDCAIIKQSGAEDRHADSSDTRIGLSETDRRLIICDLGDINTDFGLAKNINPCIYFYNTAGTHFQRLSQTGFYSSVNYGAEATYFTFDIHVDRSSGNAFYFRSGSGDELTASSGTQSWISIEPKIKQTGTAGYNGIFLDVDTVGAMGSGAHNLMDLQLESATRFTVEEDGDVVVVGEITSNGITAFSYVDLDIDDTEEYELTVADGKAGWGMASLEAEWTYFRFTAAGVVTLVNNTTNVTTTDGTDNNFNIFDAGTTIKFENQLGDNKELNINVWFTP